MSTVRRGCIITSSCTTTQTADDLSIRTRLGWKKAFVPILIAMGVGVLTGAATDAGIQVASNVINGKDWNDIDYGSVALGAGIGAIAGPVLGKVGKLAIGKCRNAYALLENGIGENHLIVDQEGFELITLFRGELLRLEMVDMLTK